MNPIKFNSMAPPCPDPRVLDDLMLGLNEWQSIQDVVRIAFKAFHEVMRQQGDSIKALERTMDTKASRAELSVGMQHKANASEMAARLAEVEILLHKKADVADMDRRALKTETDIALRTQMSDLFSIIQTKSEAVETRSMRESCERQLSSLSAEVSRLQSSLDDVRASLHTKASVVEVGEALAVKADLTEVVDKLRDKPSRQQLSDAIATKASSASVDLELRQLKQEVSDVSATLHRKAESGRLEEIDHKVERLRQRVEADSDTTSAALRTLSSAFDEVIARTAASSREAETRVMDALKEGLLASEESTSHKIQESNEYMRVLMSRKADLEEMHVWMESKVDLEDVKADLGAIAEDLEGRARQEDVLALQKQLLMLPKMKNHLDKLQQDVANKMTCDRAIFSTLENKANVQDVNKALLDVCKELEARATHEYLDLLVKHQTELRTSFLKANTMARWLWKSGQTRVGGTVPWDVQAINTAPDVFLWEAGKTVVMAMLPGLYKIEAGFYSRTRPIVQVLVEGEPCLTLVSSSASAVQHSYTSATSASASRNAGSFLGGALSQQDIWDTQQQTGYVQRVDHPSGVVTGHSCVEFLSLPASSKIAVTFRTAGDPQSLAAEGFIALYKL
ncbi:hypothetical protein CEUSTIGMA_g4134.t1 [Chlamydomonas eustigma]|uniref:Uncharacterized protein n=1 Tax=Chlamydomonas eustigma TaxID=1157962 RepID=A0A250X0T2_9CHLO|nr:hypothetical protein CEUSTIGMA_g4134.t1 [Chlamydomonas eustigma]|eukprot:GAX76688.1 hypothetical protein CEUSTIGMA_g4134.t1 [Chlamydomonas eustigma]